MLKIVLLFGFNVSFLTSKRDEKHHDDNPSNERDAAGKKKDCKNRLAKITTGVSVKSASFYGWEAIFLWLPSKATAHQLTFLSAVDCYINAADGGL